VIEKTQLVVLAAFVAVTCLGSRAAAAAKYESIDVKDGGTIEGVVRWEGEIPKRTKLTVTGKDKPCHVDALISEELVVSDDAKVRWVVAYIKKIKRGKPFDFDADNPVTLDQKGCQFSPHIALVGKNQPLRVLNSDGVLHNVHLYAKKNEPFNRSMPGDMKQLDVTFDYSERIHVGCDIHRWMSSWIVVTKHPYYAVTGADGAFRLEDVPPGDYTVEIWHETLGKQKTEVTVASGAETNIEFVLKKK
jgi:hypothetical protein